MTTARLEIRIRKLTKRAKIAPEATLIGFGRIHYDGFWEESGAWFGKDRETMEAQIQAWYDGMLTYHGINQDISKLGDK